MRTMTLLRMRIPPSPCVLRSVAVLVNAYTLRCGQSCLSSTEVEVLTNAVSFFDAAHAGRVAMATCLRAHAKEANRTVGRDTVAALV